VVEWYRLRLPPRGDWSLRVARSKGGRLNNLAGENSGEKIGVKRFGVKIFRVKRFGGGKDLAG
jgi:hypothetical protein